MTTAMNRTIYQPSGRVQPLRLAFVLVAAMAACAVVSTTYFLALIAGIYVFVGGVILPAALLAYVAYLSVWWSHCRNPRLAVALGILLGLTGYLGYFHLDQSLRQGVPLHRVDRLPAYVLFRLETDQWLQGKGSVLEPQPPAANVPPVPQLAAVPPLWNLADFSLQLLLLTNVPALVGVVAANQPYSEESNRWCVRGSIDLARSDGDSLVAAIDADAIVAWAEAGPRKAVATEPARQVWLWYVPRGPGMAIDATCLLQVEEGPIYRLHVEEAAAFVGLLPTIQEIAGPVIERLAAEAEQGGDEESARIRPVPQADVFGGTFVHNLLRNAAITMLAFGPPLRLLAAALFFAAWGMSADNRAVQTWCAVLFCPLFLAGLVLWIRSVRDESTWPVNQANRLEAWLFLRTIARRLDPVVSADDDQAIYAHMIPRQYWEDEFSAGSGIEPGLLRLDDEQRVIYFEGRDRRYVVPAAAVIDCTLENPPEYPTRTSPWMVVVQVRLGSGLAELPLLPLSGIEGDDPWERALALLARLEKLCRRTFSQGQTVEETLQPVETA